MSITISPNTPQNAATGVPICFEGSAIVSIPQVDDTHLDLPTSGDHWTYNYSQLRFTKTSGTNGTYADSQVISDDTAYGLQPFYIKACNSSFANPGGDNHNVSWYIGVEDDSGHRYVSEVFKYCNSENCGPASGDGADWIWSVYDGSHVIYTTTVNFNDVFYIRSDGTSLSFIEVIGGYPPKIHTIPLPTTTAWKFVAGAAYVGNQINCLSIFRGSYQGRVPITWDAPLGGDITVSGDIGCFTSNYNGDYQICADSEFDDPVCVDITVSPLNLYPIDLQCGNCVFLGEVVKFGSNAGQIGTLTAVKYGTEIPIGTVINALEWQAPSEPAIVQLTYTIDDISVGCIIQAIEQPRVLNVFGDTISGLVPGDTFQLQTNYPYPNIIWSNVDCPNIVSENGIIHIPKRLNDSCFGKVDCYIRGSLSNVPDFSCDNLTGNEEGFGQYHILLKVQVDPIFPTPDFGGPTPLKWKPETPEYKVIVNNFEGGCSETYLKNQIAIHKWSARYDGLAYCNTNPCDVPCCDEDLGFINGFDQSFQVAKRLDDFWNLVAGTSGFFTMVDYRTGQVWKKCRFSESMARDHVNWYRTQSREVSIVWAPCCNNLADDVCLHNTCTSVAIDPSHTYVTVDDVIELTDTVSTDAEDTVFDGFGAVQWFRPEELLVDYVDADEIPVWRDHSGFSHDGTGNQLPTGAGNSHDSWEVQHDAPIVEANAINGFPAARFLTSTLPGKDPIQSGLLMGLGSITGSGSGAEMLIVVKAGASHFGGSWDFVGGNLFSSHFPESGSNIIYEAFGCAGTGVTKNFPALMGLVGEWRIYQVTCATGDWRAWLDGQLQFSDPAHTYSGVSAQVLGISNLPLFSLWTPVLEGRIAEYLFWDKQLTNDQRATALAYIQDKFNVGLPSPPVTGGLSDNFDDNSINGLLWTTSDGTVAETNQQLEINGTSSAFLKTITPYDWTDKTVSVQFKDMPTPNSNYAQQLLLADNDSFTTYTLIQCINGNLVLFDSVTFALRTVPYDPVNHAYVRLRFKTGTTYMDTSPDNINWYNQGSAATAVSITSLNLYLRHFNSTGSPVFHKWDNLDSGDTP